MRMPGPHAQRNLSTIVRPQDKGSLTICWDGNSTTFDTFTKFTAKASVPRGG